MPNRPNISDEAIRVGISACILGQEVRYNGGHKLDRFIRDTLGSFVTFVPVCPEVELGLGVPRDTIQLQRPDDQSQDIRLVVPKSGRDLTTAMLRYARRRVDALAKQDLCGYILQKNSPSCGMERVRVHRAQGMPTRDGRGLFARVLMERIPQLPVEEDGRLNDPMLRENFIERVFAYRRLKQLFQTRWTRGQLVDFHTREKMLLLAHDRPSYTALGELVATVKQHDRREFVASYRRLFLTGLAKLATRSKHYNVLQHIAGHLRKQIDAHDRQEIQTLCDDYKNALVPLVVPIALIRHHVRRNNIEYLAQQTYLTPHPKELMLRNHV